MFRRLIERIRSKLHAPFTPVTGGGGEQIGWYCPDCERNVGLGKYCRHA